jgi:hypothetical protein
MVRLRRLVLALVLGALLALALALPATAQTVGGPGMAAPAVLHAQLTGEQEAPGPGDPDGFGSAAVWTSSPNTVCYALTAGGIAPPNAAHIHEAPPGVAGPVVLPLRPPTSGFSGGCTKASPALVSDLRANPSSYYVNVHNAPYPEGAIRGQLHR